MAAARRMREALAKLDRSQGTTNSHSSIVTGSDSSRKRGAHNMSLSLQPSSSPTNNQTNSCIVSTATEVGIYSALPADQQQRQKRYDASVEMNARSSVGGSSYRTHMYAHAKKRQRIDEEKLSLDAEDTVVSVVEHAVNAISGGQNDTLANVDVDMNGNGGEKSLKEKKRTQPGTSSGNLSFAEDERIQNAMARKVYGKKLVLENISSHGAKFKVAQNRRRQQAIAQRLRGGHGLGGSINASDPHAARGRNHGRRVQPMGAREQRDKGMFEIAPEHRRWTLYMPLHELWKQYVSRYLLT